MEEHKLNLLELLDYIDPAMLNYQEWVNVGMALKYEGYSVNDWDSWSQRDSARYHDGETERKWNTFDGSTKPVTGATITQLAKDNGWKPYSADSNDSFKHEQGDHEKWLPNRGVYTKTAGQIIDELRKSNGDVGMVLGDPNVEMGAWIRFNPLDGKGITNENVVDYRYSLVESDSMSIEQQYEVLKKLELPIAILVHSGGKSLHAIVKVNAQNYPQYQERVDYLYKIVEKNGLKIDRQNKNPSRLTRLPGFERNGKKQYIVDRNIGQANWDEWKEYIEDLNDNLREMENMAGLFDKPIELAPELIGGVLRQGHKMLIAGPSKAGKSFALIELAISIAEGWSWFGFPINHPGRVLYVNLELDDRSASKRFVDIYVVKQVQWIS